jgi:signal transduction histidine kinase
VVDDGRGFDLDEVRRKGRRGLEGMRERVELVGGTIDISASPGEGARIHVELPVQSQAVFESETEHEGGQLNERP